jgi:hypothetical protein
MGGIHYWEAYLPDLCSTRRLIDRFDKRSRRQHMAEEIKLANRA